MHIHELWEKDLDAFLEALDRYEEQEEKDRQAIAASNGGTVKKRKAKKGAKAIQQDSGKKR